MLGNLFAEAGRIDEAHAEYRRATQLDPTDATPLYRLGDPAQGVAPETNWDWYMAALEVAPHDAYAWFAAGVHLMCWTSASRKGDHPAIAFFRRGLAADPAHGRCHDALSLLALQAHDPKRFRVHKPRATQAALDDPELEYRTFEVRARVVGETLEMLQPLLAADADPWAHLLASRLELMLGHATPAREHARRALAIAPDVAALHELAGELADAARDLDAAESAYRRAVRLDPRHARARHRLAATLVRMGRADEAAVHYEASARQPGPAWPSPTGWGTAVRFGPPEPALLASIPEPTGWSATSLGRVLTLMGYLPAALELLLPASAHPLAGRVASDHLLVLMIRLGRHADAEELARQLIARDPALPELHRWLARLEYLRGANDAATTSYHRALQLAAVA